MASSPPPDGPLPHLWVRNRAEDRTFSRSGGGDPKIRAVERRAHGRARQKELSDALDAIETSRAEDGLTEQELRALGVILVLEGAAAGYRLKLDSLERMSTHKVRQPMWLVLSVVPEVDQHPERVTIWVSDTFRGRFLELFEKYVTETTQAGQPKNRELCQGSREVPTFDHENSPGRGGLGGAPVRAGRSAWMASRWRRMR